MSIYFFDERVGLNACAVKTRQKEDALFKSERKEASIPSKRMKNENNLF
jgi:hypothetical protein